MAIDLDNTEHESNYYAGLVNGQRIALVPSFELESGIVLKSVPVAFKIWGKINKEANNVLVLCHALSGSSDAEDWWRPLMGHGKTFDYSRFFLFCANMLGSPYGTGSPLTFNPDTGCPYGPDFPATTVRDDVRLHKLVLDALGVTEVAAVIGGSMGGFSTLEWPLCTPRGYVRTIIPITTSAYHSAWGIAWGEAQRQCVFADRHYNSGWYEPVPQGQPTQGLGAARMIGMLTYRSYESFDERFGRSVAAMKRTVACSATNPAALPTPSPSDAGLGDISPPKRQKVETQPQSPHRDRYRPQPLPPAKYGAQSYLHYQAEKFLQRFDANCYVHMIDKMDTHDVLRGRSTPGPVSGTARAREEDLRLALKPIAEGSLVISVNTDVLFRRELQEELATVLPGAELAILDSQDGHDGFLLEFKALGTLITSHLEKHCPFLYEEGEGSGSDVGPIMGVSSVFGEQELDF